MKPESFDDALDASIDALRRGRALTDVLATHAAHADGLRPLLDVAVRASALGGLATQPSARLASNFDLVRGELRRARSLRPPEIERPAPPAWWRRRWAAASFSLPAGAVLALLAVGVSGAAAAALAAKPDLPALIADAVQSSWPGDALSRSDHSANPTQQPSNSPAGMSPAAGKTSAASADLAPATITVSGVVTEFLGDSLVLGAADASWSVTIVDATRITGRLETGAAATVTGTLLADGTVAADEIRVASMDATSTANGHDSGADATGGAHGNGPANTPGPPTVTPGPPNGRTPGPPSVTPGPPADHTPGPPTDRTPGPPAGHTPPGQGNGGGNGNKP